MKYVNIKNEKKVQDELDYQEAVFELEYNDLVCKFDKASVEDLSTIKARSFSSMQLRAKNAIKALVYNRVSNVLLLSGSSFVDTIDIAYELLFSIAKIKATIAYAPTKFECFGDDKTQGVLTTDGYVIMPASLILDHVKWINMIDACLCQNSNLKLIICGEASDCAQLNLIWPTLDNALKADIVMEFPADGALDTMASLVAYYKERYLIKPFSNDAIFLLCAYSCRISSDRRYLGLAELKIRAIALEAHAISKGDKITKKDVLKAIGSADFRANFISQSDLRNHKDHQILLATTGEVTGQINGLSVIETLGSSYEYGEPVRITATLRAGGDGDVVDIERKAELAGQIHAKAMMIINGFLSDEFGSEQPLPISASLVFEQSYSEIDGDSASLTGLCAVISALSDLPIRQDLAVTGAVDQFGDVQPVGGLNEKVEGFFKICRLHGLTGTQGVIIPYSCIEQLVLRPSVLKAIAEHKFHIYVVAHVSAAAKLLMQTPWGDVEDQDSICGKICTRLDNLGNVKNQKPWWHFW